MRRHLTDYSRAYARRYRLEHPKIYKDAARKHAATPRGKATMLWHAAKSRAKRSSSEFTLTKAWILERIETGTCARTGLPFDLSTSPTFQNPFSPSLDRRDPKKGYTQDNVDVVVTALNMARSDWGDGVYATVARAFLAHNPDGVIEQ